MIQPASNSATAVGCIWAVVAHIVYCTYKWLQLCDVKPEPVTFLNHLLLLLSQTPEALFAYLVLNSVPQDGFLTKELDTENIIAPNKRISLSP